MSMDSPRMARIQSAVKGRGSRIEQLYCERGEQHPPPGVQNGLAIGLNLWIFGPARRWDI